MTKTKRASDRVLASILIKAVINRDWDYMLATFPEGVEVGGVNYAKIEDFINWEMFKKTASIYPIGTILMNKCLNMAIELIGVNNE